MWILDFEFRQCVYGLGMVVVLDQSRGALSYKADGDQYANLQKALLPSLFGISEGHISPAKFELHEIGCIRVAVSGTRLVAMVSSVAVDNFSPSGLREAAIRP